MKKGAFVAAKSMDFPGEFLAKSEGPRKPKAAPPNRAVRRPIIFDNHPIVQKLLCQRKTEITETPTRPSLFREPPIIEPSPLVDPPSPLSEQDHSLDKYRKRFQVPEPVTPPKKLKKISRPILPPETLGPWEPLKIARNFRPVKPAKLRLHAQLKRVVQAFCILHRLTPLKNFSQLRPYSNKQLESSSGLNVFSNWIWLAEDSRQGRRPPFHVWVRGSRVYDLDADRGSVEEFISDCNKADRVDINRDEVRARRAKAGLPPFPYAPAISRLSTPSNE